MTIQQWQAEFGPEVPKEVLFLGTSGLRMQHMVRENLVWGLSRVMGDYHFAEDCACDDTATDIYRGQLLAAANRLGHPLTEFGLEIGGNDFEAAAARFIVEKGEQDLLRLEDELTNEVRTLAEETSHDMVTSIDTRAWASVGNQPVVMMLNGRILKFEGNLTREMLLGFAYVPLDIFASWGDIFASWGDRKVSRARRRITACPGSQRAHKSRRYIRGSSPLAEITAVLASE